MKLLKKFILKEKKIYNEADHRIKCRSLRSEEIAKKILVFYEKSEIKFKSKSSNYTIIVGNNSLKVLPKRIRSLCPKTKK